MRGGKFKKLSSGEVILKLSPEAAKSFNNLDECISADFSVLAAAAGLNKAVDFIDIDLSDLPLGQSKSDLRGFNFTGADLRGTQIRRAHIDETTIFTNATKLDAKDNTDLIKRGIIVQKCPPDFDSPIQQ
jgi:Pentapeptide repeats (8 copies)